MHLDGAIGCLIVLLWKPQQFINFNELEEVASYIYMVMNIIIPKKKNSRVSAEIMCRYSLVVRDSDKPKLKQIKNSKEAPELLNISLTITQTIFRIT